MSLRAYTREPAPHQLPSLPAPTPSNCMCTPSTTPTLTQTYVCTCVLTLSICPGWPRTHTSGAGMERHVTTRHAEACFGRAGASVHSARAQTTPFAQTHCANLAGCAPAPALLLQQVQPAFPLSANGVRNSHELGVDLRLPTAQFQDYSGDSTPPRLSADRWGGDSGLPLVPPCVRAHARSCPRWCGLARVAATARQTV